MARLYYGWRIVGVSLAMLALLVGSTFSAFGLFVLPVSDEFNLSRADANTALIILNLGGAAAAPFVGRMLDRFPIRPMIIVCTLLFGASMVTLGLSKSLWLSALILAVPLAIALLGAGTATATVLVARWFTIQRNRAMTIAVTGMSFGGVLITPLVGLLIESFGWRHALVFMACVVTAGIFALLPLVREKPGPDDVEGGAENAAAGAAQKRPQEAPMKSVAILATPQFWFISLSSALTLAIAKSITVTIVPLGQEQGLTATLAASLISVVTGAAIIGKLLVIWAGERFDKVGALAGAFFLVGVVNVVLIFSQGMAAFITCCFFLGLALGGIMPVFYALLASRFGAASFGAASGLATPLITILSAVGLRYAGEVFDRTGGYDMLFTTFAAAQFLAMALMLCARWPLRRAHAPEGAV